MDYEIYSKIKKGNINTLRTLQKEELPWAWFVCYSITQTVEEAAELLLLSWRHTIEQIANSKSCPKGSFRAALTKNLSQNAKTPLTPNAMFSSLSPPVLAQKFSFFVEAIGQMEPKGRTVFLFDRFGEFGNDQIAILAGIPYSKVNEYLSELEQTAIPKMAGVSFTEQIRLSTEFRGSNPHLFEQIVFPKLFLTTLEHDYHSIYHAFEKHTKAIGKESKEMAQKGKKSQAKQNIPTRPSATLNRRVAQKKKKTIIISVVAAILAIAMIVTIVLVIRNNNMPETTRVVTYNIDEVTYGNVSTTISGSGSLTPITKATLTLADCVEEGTLTVGTPTPNETPAVIGFISDVTVSVGDTVAAGATLAVITFDDETTANIVAPYDAVLLEFYLHENDKVTTASNVAMFMGTDGYSMTISVDETNISSVALGQEVDITIDAVSTDEELVGAVTDISYNGSTGGSVTAYGIEVTFDYVEGTYPGMSVSAEIVIEDSGNGLLVPVDAVYTSGDTKYIYLAPSGAVLGEEYEEDDLDTSKLTKVTVETGMSDGSYIVVESSSLSEGDLIVITTITSTLTGSDSAGSGNAGGGMGNFPGGGNFDFSNFDPSQFGSGFPFGG